MATSQRAALLTKLHKVLKKHYKPVSPPADRTLLEHLLYACCLENSPYDKADEAFARLQQSFFDWNEVRVSTVGELAESLTELPDPSEQATHLKRLLQAVFESHYSFDLEILKKQNLGKSEKQLENYAGATRFVVSYGVQHGLEGHSIPIDRGALDIMEILQVITPQEAEKKIVPGLERAIPKNKGIEFASLLHQFAADYVATPTSNKMRAMLAEVDPDSKGRAPSRLIKVEPATHTVANRPMPAPPPAKATAPAAKPAAAGKGAAPAPAKGAAAPPAKGAPAAPAKGSAPGKAGTEKGAEKVSEKPAEKGKHSAKPEVTKGAAAKVPEPAPKAGAKDADKGAKGKEPASRGTPPRPAAGKSEPSRASHPPEKKGSEPPRRKEEKSSESSQSPTKRLAKKKPR